MDGESNKSMQKKKGFCREKRPGLILNRILGKVVAGI